MNKKTFVNYLYTTAFQMFSLIVPLITTPYTSRVLGVAGIGQSSYCATIVSYFVLFGQLGLNLYGRREVAIVHDDNEKLGLLFRQLMLIRGILFCIIGVLFSITVSLIDERYRVLLLIYGLSIMANLFDITWLFQGFEEFKIITIRNFLVKVLCVFGIFIFVRSSKDLYVFAFLTAGMEVVSQLSLWLGCRDKIGKNIFKWNGISHHLKMALIMFAPQVIVSIYTMADKLMLGMMTTDVEVGLYTQSEKLVKMALTIISSMGMVIMPVIARMYTEGRTQNEIALTLEKTSRWVWFLGLPIIAGLCGMARGFTNLFFGKGYEEVALLMCVISPIIVFIGLSDVFGMQFLVPTNRMKEYIISTVTGAVSNILINMLLIEKFGALGASIGTVIAEFLVTLTMILYSRKWIKFNWIPSIQYIIGALLVGVTVKAIDIILPDTIFYLMIEVIIGTCMYVAVLLLFKDEFLKVVVRKLQNYIGK